MVGGGAAKEKDPVPNPVQMTNVKSMNSRYYFKPGKSLASPWIRSRPKRSPFLPRPNLLKFNLILHLEINIRHIILIFFPAVLTKRNIFLPKKKTHLWIKKPQVILMFFCPPAN